MLPLIPVEDELKNFITYINLEHIGDFLVKTLDCENKVLYTKLLLLFSLL